MARRGGRIQVWYHPRIPSTPPNGSNAAADADPRRRQLGNFLRSRRQGLSPEAVGLSGGRRRRTAGLRREEVAELAGISVDWYIRLEQGRPVNPSPATIDAVARALRLNRTEYAHVRELTRHADRGAFIRERVPGAIKRTVEQLNHPAYVTGRRWDVLAWNTAADDIFHFSRLGEDGCNILSYVLTDPSARRLFGGTWAAEARRMVAQFRATHDLWAGDPAFLELLDHLQADSPEFSGWWEAHDIGSVAAGEKRLDHPTKGRIAFEYAAFYANDDPGLKLVIYTPLQPDGQGTEDITSRARGTVLDTAATPLDDRGAD